MMNQCNEHNREREHQNRRATGRQFTKQREALEKILDDPTASESVKAAAGEGLS